MSKKHKTDPRERFAAFVKARNLSASEVGRTFDVSHVAVLDWMSGKRVPSQFNREAIEKWTRGEIVATDWDDDDDRKARARLDAIEPAGPPVANDDREHRKAG